MKNEKYLAQCLIENEKKKGFLKIETTFSGRIVTL